jgi:uncharacterized protein (TIGR02599 family)
MNAARSSFGATTRAGFTLVEILLSTAILSILMLVCVSALDQMSKSWRVSKNKVEQFREARIAFELITRNLSQATLNGYWDYYYTETQSNQPPANVTATPSAYVRQSELRFRSDAASKLLGFLSDPAINPSHAVFFQAPLGVSINTPGLGNLLNARGYYIGFNNDAKNRPPFVTESGVPLRYRYRLMEYRPPAEKVEASAGTFEGNTVYTKPDNWFQQDLEKASHVVAENIVLLILSPRVSEEAAKTAKRDAFWPAPQYSYNSADPDNSTPQVETLSTSSSKPDQGTQHLLPPIVQVTMVALDEPSASRWAAKNSDKPVNLLIESGATFTSVSDYDADLQRVRDYFTSERLNYRVFTTSVNLRNAKWDGRKS